MLPSLGQHRERRIERGLKSKESALPGHISVQCIDLGTLPTLQVLHHRWTVKLVRTVLLDRRDGIGIRKDDPFRAHQRNRLGHNQALEMIELWYFMDMARTKPGEGADRVNTAVVHELGPEGR